MKTRLLFIALAAITAQPALAQTTFHGQVRPRSEYRNPVGGGPDDFASMRLRVAIEHAIDTRLSVFAQLQDVRIWGEETNTLTDYSANGLDLHQGWLRYDGVLEPWLTATVGRMETNLGGERLVGAVNWTQQARAFDGIRLDAERSWGSATLLTYRIADETAPAIANDRELYALQVDVTEVGPGSLEAYWLYDRIEGTGDTDRHTAGFRYLWTDGVQGRVEASWQSGNRQGNDLSAYMFGARVGTTFSEDRGVVTLWYDRLSGDDPATAGNESFSTLYATGHKFYGFADVFTDIPTHTGGAGLQDIALKLSWRPADATTLGADLHRFDAVQDGGLSTSHFGDELDLTARRLLSPGLTGTVGFSFLAQDAALAEVGRLTEDLRWFYVMLDAVF